MATVERQKVRAEITFGSFTIRTPYVMSFNVRRARGQMAATFSASVKVDSNSISSSTSIIAEDIVIKAGVSPLLRTVFTGKIEKCVVNPVRNNASKVMLNISGRDVMADLDGQKINRRVKTYRDGSSPPERWAVVTNVIKQHTPRVQKFPERITDKKPKAVKELPNLPLEATAKAYTLQQLLKRDLDNRAISGIVITKQSSSAQAETEEGEE